MTQITSYPLNVIKKLIKQEFAECYPEYKIQLGVLDISDDALEPYEDACDDMIQALKVSVHVRTTDDDNPARGWHPWTCYWDCEACDFEIMRNDQVECYEINEPLKDLTQEKLDELGFNDIVIDHAPIKEIDMRQLLPAESMSDASKWSYKMPDGAKNYTVKEVVEFIVKTVSGMTIDERFAGKDIYLSHLNVHDCGTVYVGFALEPDEEDNEE